MDLGGVARKQGLHLSRFCSGNVLPGKIHQPLAVYDKCHPSSRDGCRSSFTTNFTSLPASLKLQSSLKLNQTVTTTSEKQSMKTIDRHPANPVQKDLRVLIIGAGPTGLMMACQLARFGISFRIMDKKERPTTHVLYKKFGMQRGGYYLVRPDLYLAYRANRLDAQPLKNYLQSIPLNVQRPREAERVFPQE